MTGLTPLQLQNDTVRTLLKVLDLHGPGEAGHGQRVAVYAVAMGAELQMCSEELVLLRWAATLHDVGKIQVSGELLQKLGEISDEEMEALRAHAELAELFLEGHDFLIQCLPMIRHHHEQWDGEGYPDGLREDAIPLGARIIAVAETFDLLTWGAEWRRPVSESEALHEIALSAGRQFDPKVVRALSKIQPLIQPVRIEESDDA